MTSKLRREDASESCIVGRSLQVERRSDGRRTLLRALHVNVLGFEDGYKIAIPQGFDTNFGSIASYFRCFLLWSRVDIGRSRP